MPKGFSEIDVVSGLNRAQVGDPPAVIRDEQSVTTLVDAPRGPATLTFQLTVTDPTGGQHTDTMTVTVRPK